LLFLVPLFSFHNLCASEEYMGAIDISTGDISAGDTTAAGDISAGDATATSPWATTPAASAVTAHGADLAPLRHRL
jgi:hypothetical protein